MATSARLLFIPVLRPSDLNPMHFSHKRHAELRKMSDKEAVSIFPSVCEDFKVIRNLSVHSLDEEGLVELICAGCVECDGHSQTSVIISHTTNRIIGQFDCQTECQYR